MRISNISIPSDTESEYLIIRKQERGERELIMICKLVETLFILYQTLGLIHQLNFCIYETAIAFNTAPQSYCYNNRFYQLQLLYIKQLNEFLAIDI